MTTTAPVLHRARAAERAGVTTASGSGNPLTVENLTVTFKGGAGFAAVRGVTFTVEPGRTLVLLGESGSGKSVTARSVLGLYGGLTKTTGSVRLGTSELLGADEEEMRRIRGRTLGFVPQDTAGALDPLRRVGSQVAEVLRCHRMVAGRREAGERAVQLLHDVGMADPRRAARSYPHEMSGGMRQRALIAIGVACRPEILIADEPTTALDVTVQAQILDLFERLRDEMGMGILLVTHDVGVAREVADHVAVMYAGRLVEEGPGATVLDDPVHPYTRGLLGAIPSASIPRGELRAIPGMAPGSGDLSAPGCAFAPRCPHAADPCSQSEPPLVAIGEARRSACPLQP